MATHARTMGSAVRPARPSDGGAPRDDACVTPDAPAALVELGAELEGLRAELLDAEAANETLIAELDPDTQPSARNLVHYRTLRSHDLCELQQRLSAAGLSSLGRSNGDVLETLDAILDVLAAAGAVRPRRVLDLPERRRRPNGRRALDRSAKELFGQAGVWPDTAIMATLPSEAAADPSVARGIVAAGAACVRINCAHDDPDTWRAMAEHSRSAAVELGVPVQVYMDLAGPKLRTGPLAGKPIRLEEGDVLRLRRDGAPGVHRLSSRPEDAAEIGCLAPDALEHVEPAQRVEFDDGKISCVVRGTSMELLELEVTRVHGKGKLRAGKGINLPDSIVDVPGLTAEDELAIPLAAADADLVGLSFAQDPYDVRWLRARLDEEGGREAAVVLKIETARGVDRLPDLLQAGMAGPGLGVMIARGDLAVEVGWDRLAETQETILSLCEAAHVPVIWATEVLDQLAKTGVPTRAEISDASMADRAECVMLNKGPNIVQAIQTLQGITNRATRYQRKNVALLPEVREWMAA